MHLPGAERGTARSWGAAATLLAVIELCRTGRPSRDVSIKPAQSAEYLRFIA
jgi:hypothetical protein